jgi:hypothetical protein
VTTQEDKPDVLQAKQPKERTMNEKGKYDSLIGKKLFIRTVTYHLVGEVKDTLGDLLVLTNASWVADSGRFGAALESGELDEVEYVGDAWVNMGAVADMFPWAHNLPTATQ